MDTYSVDHDYLEVRRIEMERSSDEYERYLRFKGVPTSLAAAVVQKYRDCNTARYQYMKMREELRARTHALRLREAQLGEAAPYPPATLVYKYNQTYLDVEKKNQEECCESIVKWLHNVNVEPHLLLQIQQGMVDIDFGRREEMRLIEELKVSASVLAWKEQALQQD